MPTPSSYSTEAELIAYMRDDVLQGTAQVIGWTGDDPETRPWRGPVRQALRWYGVGAIGEASDIEKLEALARLAVWRAVQAEFATAISYTADRATFQREALFKHAQEMERLARRDARPYLPSGLDGGESLTLTNEAVF